MIGKTVQGITEHDLKPGGLYRDAWERGRAKGDGKVFKTYSKMATSGDCWQATRHYLATQCNVTEKVVIDNTATIDMSSFTDEQIEKIVEISNQKKKLEGAGEKIIEVLEDKKDES